MPNDPSAVTMTPSAVGLVREHALTFEALGYRIPAALTLPVAAREGDQLPAAILLIPGSLMADVNGDYPAWNSFPHVYGHLARQLSARGHAVYRFAKLGPGTGSVMIDERAAAAARTWAGRARIGLAASEAMHQELGQRQMVPQRVLLAGHSEGSVVASQLAVGGTLRQLDGVVLLAGPSVGILEIMREQAARFAPPGAQAEAQRDIDQAVERVRKGEPIPSELAQRPAARGLGAMDEVGHRYMRESDATDPTALAAQIATPVLIVQGGRDTSVPQQHGERLRASRGAQSTEYAFFEELQHMFKVLPDGLSPMEAFGLTGETDMRVADAIDSWARRLPTAGRPRHQIGHVVI